MNTKSTLRERVFQWGNAPVFKGWVSYTPLLDRETYRFGRLLRLGIVSDSMSGEMDEWDEYAEENYPVDTEQASGELARMAENWYESITEERIKKKMMVNYIMGVLDDGVMTRQEVIKMLEENDAI